MKTIMLIGEPMAMFVANTVGSLENVEQYTKMLAGAEVNVCIALKRLGFNPIYVTKLGDEPMGRSIFNRLKQEGIDTSNITFDKNYLTGLQFKGMVLEGDPEVSYFRRGSAASHLSEKDIETIDMSLVNHLHVTGIPFALSEECRKASFLLLKKAKEHNIPITFDPNIRPTLWPDDETMRLVINEAASYGDIIMPGIEEGIFLTGKTSPEEISDFYLEKGARAVIIKQGDKGAYLCEKNSCELVAGFKVDKVVDTVGAGDGFASGIISGLLDGLSLADSVVRGNVIGAIQVTHKGDNEGLPTREQLKSFMERGF